METFYRILPNFFGLGLVALVAYVVITFLTGLAADWPAALIQ